MADANTERGAAETLWVNTPVGDRVAYDVHDTGRGEGPAVVFIAGAGPYRALDPNTAQTAVLLAERGIRTYVYDRIGRGESVAEGALTLERELSAVAAVLEVAGGHAVLWGQSSGSAIALRAASDGLAVDGLALWEAPLAQIQDADGWAREFARLVDAGDDLGALEHYSKDMPPEMLKALKESPRLPQILQTIPSQRADAAAIAWADRAIATGGLATIAVPVLAMTGEITRPVMAQAATAIATAVPNGRAVTVGGARHRWEPEAMAVAVADFTRTLG